MAKRFECPRCGAGIRPNDIQCGRCGEVLPDTNGVESRSAPLAPSVNVGELVDKERIPDRFDRSSSHSVSDQKEFLDEGEIDLAGRDNELVDENARILPSLGDVSRKARPLEEPRKTVEATEAGLREREEALVLKEREFEELSKRLEKNIKELDIRRNVTENISLSSEELERLLALREDHENVLRKDRGNLKKRAEKELKARVERIDQLERQLKAAQESLTEREIGGPPRMSMRGGRQERALDATVMSDLINEINLDIEKRASSPTKIMKEKKIKTQIERLDIILDGGIPTGSTVLINGTAGSMKSTISYYILHHNAVENGIRGMYFSLEQKRDSLIRQMERLGMHREESKDDLMVVDMVDLRKSMRNEEGDWRSILMRYVKNIYEERNFNLFVLDSLESLKALTDFEFLRTDIKDLFDWLGSMNLTTLIVSERSMDSLLENTEDELYLADGAIELIMKEVSHGRIQRWVRCMKMRGANIDTRYYSFSHDGEKFNLTVPLVGTS
jgi:KaiC/GvpD/RAD55 family RecA-like ATPase